MVFFPQVCLPSKYLFSCICMPWSSMVCNYSLCSYFFHVYHKKSHSHNNNCWVSWWGPFTMADVIDLSKQNILNVLACRHYILCLCQFWNTINILKKYIYKKKSCNIATLVYLKKYISNVYFPCNTEIIISCRCCRLFFILKTQDWSKSERCQNFMKKYLFVNQICMLIEASYCWQKDWLKCHWTETAFITISKECFPTSLYLLSDLTIIFKKRFIMPRENNMNIENTPIQCILCC